MKNKLIILVLSVTFLFSACKKETEQPAPTPTPTPVPVVIGDNHNMLLGNPTNAQTTTTVSDNFLLDHTYWIASYSNSRGTSNWVSWHLQADEDLGSTPRQDDFRPDDKLPNGFYLVQHTSYSGSGFDRGHNCPSGDETKSVAANSSTFYMTNMIPQAPKFNQGPWEGMEDFIRTTLVGSNNEAYIIMGNYGMGGIASTAVVNKIDNNKVTVPKKVFKIVVVLPKGDNDLARLTENSTILVVDMPNDNTLYSTSGTGKTAWRNYITTVNTLEQNAASEGLTLNLLSSVPATVRAALKAKLYQ